MFAAPGTSLGASSNGKSYGSSVAGGRPGKREADGGWSISWCKDVTTGQLIAVAADTDGLVKVCDNYLAPSIVNGQNRCYSSPTPDHTRQSLRCRQMRVVQLTRQQLRPLLGRRSAEGASTSLRREEEKER